MELIEIEKKMWLFFKKEGDIFQYFFINKIFKEVYCGFFFKRFCVIFFDEVFLIFIEIVLFVLLIWKRFCEVVIVFLMGI